MNEQQLLSYNQAQIKEIRKYQWIESEKAGFDIGEKNAAMEWIFKYSKEFRNFYMQYIWINCQ